MNNAERVIVNTSAQYIRTIINLCLSLYSTRLILIALGVGDYGIYVLVAGTISLLSFVVNALVVTTQRYMSFYKGKNEFEKLKEVFCNSMFIHLTMGVVVALIIEIIGMFLFDSFFNITLDRTSAAKFVFHCVTLMFLLSFLTAPFRALLISHENIVYISFIDVLDGFLKLFIALVIASAQIERLKLYAGLLCVIQVFNFFALSIYDGIKYKECVFPRFRLFSVRYIKEIFTFASWTIYSVGCIVGRTQGVSLILNKFFSVAVNAAYGVALQVNGALSFLSQSVMNAMNPQIVKAEGAGDRNRMLRLAEIESKFCFLLISMIVIPCIFEMPAILELWLSEVPEHTVMFCRFIVLSSMIDQLTIGLGTANQAIGKIREYSLAVNTVKVISLLPIVVVLFVKKNLIFVMSIYALFELLCAILRLVFLKKTAGLSIIGYVRKVFLLEVVPVLSAVFVSIFSVTYFNFKFRFLLTILLSICAVALFTFMFGLYYDEKGFVRKIFHRVVKNA